MLNMKKVNRHNDPRLSTSRVDSSYGGQAPASRGPPQDMGGAASVLALAEMVMSARLRVRLRVLVPAVENSISADAFRPGDVIRSRKGLTVEIGNTDAEGA